MHCDEVFCVQSALQAALARAGHQSKGVDKSGERDLARKDECLDSGQLA